MTTKLTNVLAQLPQDVVINGSISHPYAEELIISFPEAPRICPACGSMHCVIKGSPYRQTVHHLPSSGRRPILLTFNKRRYLCKDCGRSFMESPEWLHPSMRITVPLFHSIMFDLTEMLSCTVIARKNCVPDAMVYSILDSVEFGLPEHLPETLCIDEFHGGSGTWNKVSKRWNTNKFHVNIADADAKAVIDILPQIKAEHIINYFFQFDLYERKRVKFFCCDMHNGFVSVARYCFPDAVICIDMFHVINRLNTAMDEIRRRIQNDIRDNDPDSYVLLKNSARALTTKEPNLLSYWRGNYTKKKARLNAILSSFTDLRDMYDALQDFHIICSLDSFILKRTDLSGWIRKYIHSDVPEIRAAAHTIQHWRRYIENTWEHNKSNGAAEELNKDIKNIKRISSGVHSFETFRKRILLVCGYIHLADDFNKSVRMLLEKSAKKKSGGHYPGTHDD